jgi:hypothetical protein
MGTPAAKCVFPQEFCGFCGQVRIGPGLQQADGRIVADRAGVVRSAPGGKLWLDVRQKRWVC